MLSKIYVFFEMCVKYLIPQFLNLLTIFLIDLEVTEIYMDIYNQYKRDRPQTDIKLEWIVVFTTFSK